jgi:hypothetical protein
VGLDHAEGIPNAADLLLLALGGGLVVSRGVLEVGEDDLVDRGNVLDLAQRRQRRRIALGLVPAGEPGLDQAGVLLLALRGPYSPR